MSISSRKQINDILQDYYETEQEFLAQIWNPKVRQWSPNKQAIYNNGVVIGKYLEHDYTTEGNVYPIPIAESLAEFIIALEPYAKQNK